MTCTRRADERTLLLSGFFPLDAANPVDLLEEPPDGSSTAAKGVAHVRQGFLHQRPRPLDEPIQDANAVAEQATVGRMVDRGLHTGAVDPELAGTGDLGLFGQQGGTVNQGLQRRRADGLRPARQGGFAGYPLEVHPHKPAQDQRVGDPLDGFLVAPGIQVLDHQQPEQHLGRRRVPTMHGRQPVAAGQVCLHLLVERVVIQQLIQLDEDGIGLVREFRHPREHIFWVVAVDEHRNASP